LEVIACRTVIIGVDFMCSIRLA